jgi:hypothetical protein
MPGYNRLHVQSGDPVFYRGKIYVCTGREYGKAKCSLHYSETNRDNEKIAVPDGDLIRILSPVPYYGSPQHITPEVAIAKILSGRRLAGYSPEVWQNLYAKAKIGTLTLKESKKLLADAGYEKILFYFKPVQK